MSNFNDRRLGTAHSPSYGKLAADGVDRNEYTRDYRKGYRHASTAVNRNPERGSGDAWKDGYSDADKGRSKYSLRGHRFGAGDPVEGY